MGCDIHGWVEISYYGEEWKAVVDIGSIVGRNYYMFSKLFGVRGDGEDGNEPIAYMMGIPDDASKIVKEKYADWEEDAHSPSYITLEDLDKVEFGEELSRAWEELFRIMYVLSAEGYLEPKNIRLVVWFDN